MLLIIYFLHTDLTILYVYMKSDGWFPIHRKGSAPCTFVTAFALEVLADAVEAEWEHILYIGE